jgi:hypothetical protein
MSIDKTKMLGAADDPGQMMSIQTIPRPEFDRLLPLNPALEHLMVEQVEWFSSKSGRLLGAIAKGRGFADWNYAILKRDRKGDFRVRHVMGNFFNLRAARIDLLLSMADIESLVLQAGAGCHRFDG